MNLDWPPPADVTPGAEYAQYAEIYDVLFEDRGVDVEFYVNAASASLPPGGELLELGTGTGRLTRRLLEAGYRVTGVDPSAAMLSRATERLGQFGDRLTLVNSRAESMELGRRFALAIGPFAVVSHLFTNADRLAAFRKVHDHLEPGGIFLFDDMPSWLAGAADGSSLELFRTGTDPVTGLAVRVMTNTMDVAGDALSVRYDFVDWLTADHLIARRMVLQMRFRNIPLDDEIALLTEAGFDTIDLLGGFDGRPFSRDDLHKNTRLIFRCRRSA